MAQSTFLERIRLHNYKSIAACDVELGPLTFLVGPNGAGKSNFLDALRLVSDALRTSLDGALRERGGIHEVERRRCGQRAAIGIRLDLRLRDSATGHYAFTLAGKSSGGYEVREEECLVRSPEGDSAHPDRHYYRVQAGEVVESSVAVTPAAAPDRLYLVNASGLPVFRSVYDSLSHMCFYNLNPDRIRDLQAPDSGELLRRDGSNLASVLRQIATHDNGIKQRIEEYLSKVVPGIRSVNPKTIGPRETIEFEQEVAAADEPWQFLAGNMSDGTLRVLAILVALLQSGNGPRLGATLVGIEEPELALHPAAAGVLLDSLRDAVDETQVIVTSHSPDLLDDPDIDGSTILAVVLEKGETRIGPLNEAGRSALRDHLYTAGELLRLNQLSPDHEVSPLGSEISLFSEKPGE